MLLFSELRQAEIRQARSRTVSSLYSRASARSFFPGRILDLDAVAQALLLTQALDLTGIEHALAALGGRGRFEIVCELGDLALEILQRAKRGDVEHGHEAAVIVPARGLDAETEAGEQAAQDLDHCGEAAALVALGAAERQQRAALAILGWIGSVPSLGIDDPPRRDFLAAGDRELDLAGRDRRGRHVQVERRIEVGRHRDRDRIGAEPCLLAAEWRHMLRRTAGIRRCDPDHAFAHCHQRIGGEAADMALPEHGAGGDIRRLRFLDRQRHRLGVDVEAKTPLAVDHGRRRRFLHDGPSGAGHDVAGLDPVNIGGNGDHAVGIVAGEIGVDAAVCDRVGLFLGSPGNPKQRCADAREAVGMDDRHGASPAWCP
ncbi:hypothetical protein ACVWZV_002762 [Bradyrhizobium sp. GM5.1]